MPRFDVRERHTVTVRAPAPLVYQVAREIDVQSIPLVRAIFWARANADAFAARAADDEGIHRRDPGAGVGVPAGAPG